MTTQAQGYTHASLYVGDLHPEVDERILYELFKEAGAITSIHVCRDAVSRQSLGYAYVNYHNASDAEKAIEHLNYTTIHDRPIRIMWSQRDPSLRKSGLGNIFVKNLIPDIDEKSLSELFSRFGQILSCKISYRYKNGERISNGYGFVHFKDTESAEKAIDKMNGKYVNDRQVTVTHYKPKSERQKKSPDETFTNVYIKNLPKDMDKDKLTKMFSEFGEVQNAVVITNEEGNSRGFGFANFFTHEAAKKAVEALNGRSAGDEEDKTKTFVACRAMTKDERTRFLSEQRRKNAQFGARQDTNLYVRNFPDDMDEEKLKEMFAPFGEIRSVKVMRDKNKKISRGFGFVCFTRPEDAAKAIQQMHGQMNNGKPLYVALHQSRIVRKNQLDKLRREQGVTQFIPPGPMIYGQFGYPMPAMGYPQNAFNWERSYIPAAAHHMLSDEEKKQKLGNDLYNLVRQINSEFAAKITGMFLELEESEIQELLTDNNKLQSRVQEALNVLHAAQHQQS